MKTAAELKITQWERDGLVAFTEAKIRYNPQPRHALKPGTESLIFNMIAPAMAAECGTVCCIGGFVWYQTHKVEMDDNGNDIAADSYVSSSSSLALLELYFPSSILNYKNISLERAQRVTRHFLDTGVIDWKR